MYSFYIGDKYKDTGVMVDTNCKRHTMYDKKTKTWYRENVIEFTKNKRYRTLCSNIIKMTLKEHNAYDENIFNKYFEVINNYKNQFDKGLFKERKEFLLL